MKAYITLCVVLLALGQKVLGNLRWTLQGIFPPDMTIKI